MAADYRIRPVVVDDPEEDSNRQAMTLLQKHFWRREGIVVSPLD
jgi:hypothetical protein